MRIESLVLCVLIASPSFAAITDSYDRALSRAGCADFESSLWDISYSALLDAQTSPLNIPFARNLNAMVDHSSTPFELRFLLSKKITQFYDILSLVSLAQMPLPQQLEELTGLEIGRSLTPEEADIQGKLRTWRAELPQLAGLCHGESKPATVPALDVATGSRHVFATSYQSCELEKLPPIGKHTSDLRGVSIDGFSGGGTIRHIYDLPAFLQSDYYYSQFTPGPSCKDLRLDPLMYNYGGKPKTSVDPDAPMDLFTSAGEGVSPVLGIDCSAFVFTTIAASGLRLSSGKPLKAVLVHGVNSNMFKAPEQNGMSCLQNAKMGVSGTLKAGDIIAKNGHVAIFVDVGPDPLGIAHVKSDAECGRVDIKNFDFTIIQSSSSKGGIGINKFIGRDYMLEEGTFRKGLEQYAEAACHARLKNTDVLVSSNEISVIRHTMTADCQQERIPLVGEECTQNCYFAK